MGLVFLFFQAFAISFLGSVPPGAINLSLVQKAAEGKKRKAVFWAFLASLMESPHFFIAWFIHFHWLNSPDLFAFTKPLSMLILMVLGWNSWKSQGKTGKHGNYNLLAFLGLNLLNIAALPFWLGTFQWAMPSSEQWFVFWVASSMGAFLCLFLYARLWLSKSQHVPPLLLQKSAAISVFGLAIWQFFNLLPIF